jgi:hypothetical protein
VGDDRFEPLDAVGRPPFDSGSMAEARARPWRLSIEIIIPNGSVLRAHRHDFH